MPREYFGCWNRTFGDLSNTETASEQTRSGKGTVPRRGGRHQSCGFFSSFGSLAIFDEARAVVFDIPARREAALWMIGNERDLGVYYGGGCDKSRTVPLAAMDNYRLFVYRDDGQLVGSAVIIHAANDDEAIAQAEVVRGSFAAELLDIEGLRIVKYLPGTGEDKNKPRTEGRGRMQSVPNMTQQPIQRFTSAQWSVLRYAANHGPAAKIGGKWLRSCRTLEQRGLLFVWRCTTGCHAIRLTAAGAEALAQGRRRGH
jgi:hypothetical protein